RFMGGKLPGHVASYPPSLCARSYIDDGSRRLNFKNPGWFDPLVYSVVIYLYRGLSRFVVCHRTPSAAAGADDPFHRLCPVLQADLGNQQASQRLDRGSRFEPMILSPRL